MSYQACLDAITRAAGKQLSDEELDVLLTELQERTQIRLSAGDDIETAARTAADEYAKEMAANAIIAKRNKALQLKTDLERLDKIESQFGANKVLGLESVLTGVNNAATGSRISAATMGAQRAQRNLSHLQTRLRGAGLLEIWNDGAMDREISQALESIDSKIPAPAHLPKEAVKIAEIVAEVQESARLDVNSVGGYIKKLGGYITRQSHDQYLIQKAGFKAWRDEILPRLDPVRTFGTKDPEKFLEGAWRGLASGVHMKSQDQNPGGFAKTVNIAKKMSEERVLHFKPGMWFDYNQKFGMGSLRQSVEAQLDRMGQDYGLMKIMGPNPREGFDRTVQQLLAREKDPAKAEKLKAASQGMLKNRLAEVTGETRTPVNAILASRSATYRAVQNMAKLGAAPLAQVTDIALYGSEMRYQGRTMLSGMAESLKAIGKGKSVEERNNIYGALGVYFEHASGSVHRYAELGDRIPGMVSKAQQLFFKLNLMKWISDSQRAAAVMGSSHWLARHSNLDHASLGVDLKRTLGLYGIGAREWEIVRKAVGAAEDGLDYATPELIESMPDEVFAGYVTSFGQKATPTRIAAARRDVGDQLRSYLLDRATFAQLMPDARSRSVGNQGTRPGTALGELDRLIMQFKSFSVAVIQKTLGRELFGRGAPVDARIRDALRGGNGELLGLANLIVYTTIMGYMSMTLKQLAKGKEPRIPEKPSDILPILMASMVQGGGLGLYGDFLFGETNRFGGGIVETTLGPTAGLVADVHDIWKTLTNPSEDNRARDAAAKSFRTLLTNTPYANLFYTRVVMDYLVVYGMQEFLSPGYLRRMERNMKNKTDQEFLLKPSQHANQF